MYLMKKNRQPRNVKPPNRVDQKPGEYNGPGLTIFQKLKPADGRVVRLVRSFSFVLADRFEFFRRQPFVCRRLVVDQQPNGEPCESEQTCNNKDLLPVAEVSVKPDDHRGCNDRTDSRAAVKDRHAERALPGGEPFSNGLCCARPVAGFANTKYESKRAQTADADRKRVSHRRNRPNAYRRGESL